MAVQKSKDFLIIILCFHMTFFFVFTSPSLETCRIFPLSLLFKIYNGKPCHGPILIPFAGYSVDLFNLEIHALQFWTCFLNYFIDNFPPSSPLLPFSFLFPSLSLFSTLIIQILDLLDWSTNILAFLLPYFIFFALPSENVLKFIFQPVY